MMYIIIEQQRIDSVTFHLTYIALNIFSIIENKFNNIVTVIYEYLTNTYSILINIHTDKYLSVNTEHKISSYKKISYL